MSKHSQHIDLLLLTSGCTNMLVATLQTLQTDKIDIKKTFVYFVNICGINNWFFD